MPVSWKKAGRGIETIVVVALVIAVALLWQRDRPEAVPPAAVPMGEPAVGRAGKDVIDDVMPVERVIEPGLAVPPVTGTPPAALLPTPGQYRPNYELVIPSPVTATAIDCGSIDVTTGTTAEPIQYAGNQPDAILKIATMAPNQSLFVERIRAAAKIVAAKTSGRVSIKIYGGGTQGTAERVLQKIKIGQLQGGTFEAADFQHVYADLSIYGLPFFFDSDAEISYVRERMDGALTGGLREVGFVSFGFAGSFARLMSNQPFSSLEELRGARMWLPEGDALLHNWMRLYYSPVPLPITDVLTGLRIGLLGSVIVSPEVAVALQWHTGMSVVVDQPVSYAMTFMAVSRRAFEGLSRQDQDIAANELRRVYCEMNQVSGVQAAEAIERMVKTGINVLTLPDHDVEALRQNAREFGESVVKSGYLSAELYNEVQRLTDEYRRLAPTGGARN